MLKLDLPRANKILVAAIVVINVYIIALPLYPDLTLWWQDHIKHTPRHLNQLIISHKTTTPNKPAQAVPTGERLIIPVISFNQNIVEGKSIYTVNKGVWHFPRGSSPGQTGNTVFIGHRFTYAGPAVFAHLDLVKIGDTIAVWWNGTQYTYKVSQIKIVSPNDTSIIQPTDDKRLTIYTCTPMWSTKYRLAVIAEQDKK